MNAPALNLHPSNSDAEIPHVPANVEGRSYWFWMSPQRPPTMREIAALVAERHGLSLDELRGSGRARRLAWPRQEAYALIYATGRFSLPQIGRFFGKFDHTSVHHGIKAYQGRLQAAREALAA